VQAIRDVRLGSGAPPSEEVLDFLGLWRTLWRNKLMIAFCGLLALVAAGYYAYGLAKPSFRAVAQLSLQIRTETVIDVESVLSGISSDQSSINTEIEVLRSRALIGQLVDQMNLVADPDFNPALRPEGELSLASFRSWLRETFPALRPAAVPEPTENDIRNTVIDRVRDVISITVERQSFVFSIAATSSDPIKAQMLANGLAELYRADQIQQKVEATESAAVWLSQRVSELEGELEGTEAQINDLRAGSALISDDLLGALNEQSIAVTAELQAAELGLVRAQDRLTVLQSTRGTDYAAMASAAMDSQLQGLAAAADSGDNLGAQRFERRFAQLITQAEAEVQRAQVIVDDLRQRAASISDQFERQSAALVEIQQLERESEATRVLYETFLGRLKETTVQVGVHQADSRILSPAIRGEQVAPRRSLVMAVGLLLGAIIGAVIALARESMHKTYRTVEQLEQQNGLTVLGEVPRLPVSTRQATVAYLAKKPASAAAEAVRNLRTSILLSKIDMPPKVILFTSSVPGEGKTTISVSLAQNLAGLQKRVILVEGDIRRRTFSEYFAGAKDRPGLLSVLSKKTTLSDAIWADPELKVDVLMGEKSNVNAADLFSSQSFRDLMEELRQSYDYIIIDTPPVLVVPDARIIAAVTDALIYVVKWDHTTHSQVQEGLRQLRTVNINVSGLVLSQVDARGMRRYGYGGQYGPYSRYAKGYYEA
jgi:polysaccharide biosynthesis transport protein